MNLGWRARRAFQAFSSARTFPLKTESAPLLAAYNELIQQHKLSIDPDQLLLAERLQHLQNQLKDSSPSGAYSNVNRRDGELQKGLYIHGTVGTGKTRIMDLFAATLPPDVTCSRVHFHSFMLDIHARLHNARSNKSSYSGDPLPAIGRQVAIENRVLCFDEFQVSDIADAMILKRLFGGIFEMGGVMVATSNRHPKDLYENGLNRPLFIPFINLLLARCDVYEMSKAADYRMKTHPSDQPSYFITTSPSSTRGTPETSSEFRTSYQAACQNISSREENLRVQMNRSLPITITRLPPPSTLIIARSSFSSLVKANLGSADYTALCRASRCIYIDGVHALRSDELDWARRFITLIDIAYESKTKLILSSSCRLVDLFRAIAYSPNAQAIASKSFLQKDTDKEKSMIETSTNHADNGRATSVRKGGGASSSMAATFIGEMEWSATGLPASLADGGAGAVDVRFAVGRAVSRLVEMGSIEWDRDRQRERELDVERDVKDGRGVEEVLEAT